MITPPILKEVQDQIPRPLADSFAEDFIYLSEQVQQAGLHARRCRLDEAMRDLYRVSSAIDEMEDSAKRYLHEGYLSKEHFASLVTSTQHFLWATLPENLADELVQSCSCKVER